MTGTPEQRVKPEDEGRPCELGIPGESKVPDSAPSILSPMASAPQPMAWAGAVVGESYGRCGPGTLSRVEGRCPSPRLQRPRGGAGRGSGALRNGATLCPASLGRFLAPVFLALHGRLTFDWVDPRTLIEEGERAASPL